MPPDIPPAEPAAEPPARPRRLVGSGRIAGMVQLHQALPLIERQHALIEELRARAPRFVPGADLAARTGTNVRTVERDIARLVAAGVAVQVRRGPGGGYRIDARRELPPLTLTPGEAAALVASLVAVGPYISAAAHSALAKLLAALSGEQAGKQGEASGPS
jgi:predicted DNA-binding transcriptional regulator YafY